ncbi:MAG: ABC transporter permease [Nocardioidaceae bacterium]|nr:ABC transporter permease [Nocardioidaceae bacterium]
MSTLTGTGLLVRLDLRRDRILAPVWIAVLLMMTIASAAATPSLYKTQAELVRAADAINSSPAIVALYGPILDPTSKGEVAMTKMTVLYALFAAVFFVVVVRRHTRVEEESGRTELVGGTAVGRDAPLAAAILSALVWAVVLAVLVALGNIASGLDSVGSIAFGLMWLGVALVAIGIGAVTAQVAASARTCASWAAAILGLLYVLRAAGDTGPTWLSWCSPFGWNTQLRAWSGPRWWLLLAYVAVAAALVAAAIVLRARRDLGSGLIAARPGPAYGSARLDGALALVVKLHATPLVLWTLALAVMGVLFGAITPTLNDFLDTVAAQQMLDKLGGALIAAILSVIAILIGYFASTVFSHASRDEAEGRAELVLATATSRTRWAGAYAALGLAGVVWLLAVTGVGLWIGYAVADGPGIGNLVVAALAWAPAVWVVAALGLLSLALRPSLAALVWVWPAIFFVFTTVAELFEAPGWLLGISPYRHVPQLPADSWSWPAELGLTAVAAVVLVAAWWRFQRRDLG